MGMDIYGIAPHTEIEKGKYFRNTATAWRETMIYIDTANKFFDLNINTASWFYNDGDGLKTQEQCDELADALQTILMLKTNLTHDDGKHDDVVRKFIVFLRNCGGFVIW